jgi:hypothetical protein
MPRTTPFGERNLAWLLAITPLLACGQAYGHGDGVAGAEEASGAGAGAGSGADGPPADPRPGGVDTGPGFRPGPYRETRTLEVDGVRVEAIIDRPANDTADAMLLYHGTVVYDDLVMRAAEETLERFGALLDRRDLLLVSVAYPEEGLLMGDNLAHAEAALLWVQRHAADTLGVTVRRLFLAGHSQGGYLVTRLGTLHAVDGIIASAPGPMDLVFRCGLEESGRLEGSVACANLAAAYGSTTQNAAAYQARSLLSFTSGQRSGLLVVQGLDDSPIQMRSWPIFRERLEACTDCQSRTFVELPGLGHPAMFESAEARRAFLEFVQSR